MTRIMRRFGSPPQIGAKVIKASLGTQHGAPSPPGTAEQIRAQIDRAIAMKLSPKIVDALRVQWQEATFRDTSAQMALAQMAATSAYYPVGTKVLDVLVRYGAREAPIYAQPSEASDRVAVVPHSTPVTILENRGEWCRIRTGLDQPFPMSGYAVFGAEGAPWYGAEPWYGGLFRINGWVPCAWIGEPQRPR